jgi:hypothetical protein
VECKCTADSVGEGGGLEQRTPYKSTGQDAPTQQLLECACVRLHMQLCDMLVCCVYTHLVAPVLCVTSVTCSPTASLHLVPLCCVPRPPAGHARV